MQVSCINFNLYDSRERVKTILSLSKEKILSSNDIDYETLQYDNAIQTRGVTLCVVLKNFRIAFDEEHLDNLKIYRCFLSEITALLRSYERCREIDQHDGYIMAVYVGATRENVHSVFNLAAKILSLVSSINEQLTESNIKPMKVGIGIDMGYYTIIGNIHEDSPSSEVHWISSANGQAYNLGQCSNSTLYDEPIMVTKAVFLQLPNELQTAFNYNSTRNCMQCNLLSPIKE